MTFNWIKASAIILYVCGSVVHAKPNESCEFSSNLSGEWFQSGRRDRLPVHVNRTHFSDGRCVQVGKSNRYLVYVKSDNCYKCMVINRKHKNVIQFKESYCDPDQRDWRSACQEITGDAILYSMFRINSEPVRCPFGGPLTFTYSKGYGECKDPLSQVDSCAEDSRLLFRQQACADVPKSEVKEEELVCLGIWKDGSNHYLAGKINHKHATKDEDRYRCYIYEKPSQLQNNHVPFALGSTGDHDSDVWHLAVSADATCQGLVSAYEGGKTMKLKKAHHAGKKCKFPNWLSRTKHWHTLDYSQSYILYHHNTSIKVSNGTKLSHNFEVREHSDLRLVCHEYQAGHESHKKTHHHSRNHHEDTVTAVVHFTIGCRSGYKCMRIYRRDLNVIQIQFGSEALVPNEACNTFYWQPSSHNMVTLVSQEDNVGSCGPLGRYHIPIHEEMSCDEADPFHKLTVGCSTFDTLQLHQRCTTATTESYQCHSQWEAEGVTFVVASPMSRASSSPRRVCFAYLPNGDDSPNVIFTSRHDTCIDTMPGARMILNATLTGQCAKASGISSSSTMMTSTIFVSIICLIIYIDSCLHCDSRL